MIEEFSEICSIISRVGFFLFVFFGFCLFVCLATPVACGISWSRDETQGTAVTTAIP